MVKIFKAKIIYTPNNIYMYSDKIMRNELNDLPDQELMSILITLDGRGEKNKKKALNILLKRAYDNGMNKMIRAYDAYDND